MLRAVANLGIPFIAALALACTPVAAQDMPADDPMAALGTMFPVEPLTPEQAARVPQARAVIERIMPSGTMQDMMGGMFNTMLGPMMQAGADDPASIVSETFGYDVTASAEEAAELAALIDPAWRERRQREMELMPTMMGRITAAFEPSIKTALTDMYAIHFSDAELAGIDLFFATPIGAAYARKSFAMSSDPRLIGSMMQSMPQMMGSFASMEQEIAAATADLPAKPAFADLSASQLARLSELTGFSVEDLQFYIDGVTLSGVEPVEDY